MTYRDNTKSYRRLARLVKKIFVNRSGKSEVMLLATGLIMVTAISIIITGILRQPQKDIYTPTINSSVQQDANVSEAVTVDMSNTAGIPEVNGIEMTNGTTKNNTAAATVTPSGVTSGDGGDKPAK